CPNHGAVVLEAFLDSTEPAPSECGARPANLTEMPWPFQLAFYTPRPGEPMPSPAAVEVANRRSESDDD
ncbi:MAG TPA: hypothetical protein PLS95_11125, partial [Thermoanaerobaculales bacterium]|nr:hypothetical protein [Thermoanaerobaculales bacterium]